MNDLKKYHLCRPHIKTGDNIEFASDGLIGRMIMKITKQDVSHTAKVITFDFDPDRIYLVEALNPGVIPNLLSNRLRNYNGKVYWIPMKPKFDSNRPLIARYAMRVVAQHVRYDFISIIKQLFGKVSVDASLFFCSEFTWAADFYAKAYQKELKKAPYPGQTNQSGAYLPRVEIL